MTAHRCCPECGAEFTADGGKFCGCVGPFTAEHIDPMHIRPYVDLPEPEDEGTHTPDLEPFARCGQGDTAELPAVRPHEAGDQEPGNDWHSGGGGSSGHEAFAYGAQPFEPYAYEGEPYREEREASVASPDGPGGPEAAPGRRRGGHRRQKGRGAYVYGRDEAPRKRRGPARAAVAAAGVVAALGAGLLTAQTLTSEDGGDDRSLSTDDTALPDLSGGPTEEPSRTEKKRSGKPERKQSPRDSTASSRADRDGGHHTDRVPAPAPSSTSSSSSSSSSRPGAPGESEGGDPGRDGGWGGQGGGHDGDRDRPRPPQDSTQPGSETLRPGDSGPEVSELQRRLKQAGALDQGASEDGVYSQEVQQAVARFQAWNDVQGDEFGEYGPNTRRALESQTSG